MTDQDWKRRLVCPKCGLMYRGRGDKKCIRALCGGDLMLMVDVKYEPLIMSSGLLDSLGPIVINPDVEEIGEAMMANLKNNVSADKSKRGKLA